MNIQIEISDAEQVGENISLAVIVPAFKQPGLLLEALHALLGQRTNFATAAVVVNDGCPYAETRDAALTCARQYPGRVCYVQTRNSGLSAARNAGIEFALRAWPSLDALYLLDADNRLHPEFLSRAYACLKGSPPEIGWVYPDFDVFGIPENHTTRGPYSLLAHLLKNYCEAGSLIRRTVIDAGIRFDEEMRTGQEDWDFWLQAASAGFRGRHLPRSGFQYRRRAESMWRASEASRETTVARLRRKHAALFRPRALIALAQDEMPNYALFGGDGQVRQIADPLVPDEGRTLEPSKARQEFFEATEHPASAFFPPVMCFADAHSLAALQKYKLIRNVFWRANILLRDRKLVAVQTGIGESAQFGLRADGVENHSDIRDARLLFVRSRDLAAWLGEAGGLTAIIEGLKRDESTLLHATLPAEAASFGGEIDQPTPWERLCSEHSEMRAMAEKRKTQLPPDWRADRAWPRNAEAVLNSVLGLQTIYPHRKKDGVRDFGVILPRCEFGGIERGKGNYAHVLRGRGWRPHLFLTKPTTAYLSPLAFEAFESVNFVSIEEAEQHHPEHRYFGMWTSGFAKKPAANDLIGLLGSMDAIINNHSFAAHAVAARLRQFGVNMTVGVHMTERTPAGNPLGTPHSVLAYEHAYDGIIVISDMLREWSIGQGIPKEKLHLVRNAPSYPIGHGVRIRSLKAKKRDGGPLNVLFLGRLDRQKGLDRLAEIIRRTRGDAIVWRLVGKAVIEDTGSELKNSDIVIEPPVHAAEDLDALYEWADVMILTSRFEGVPLSILEAKRAGCVALSTDVGAVKEIISHGIDGLIVPVNTDEEAIVSAFCGHLERLAGSRLLIRAMGLRAAWWARQVRWDKNLKDWVAGLEAECDLGAHQISPRGVATLKTRDLELDA